MVGLLGEDGRDEGGQRADDDVDGAVGAEQVGHQAAHKNTRPGAGEKEGEHRQGLGEAELDGAVGQVHGRGHQGQGGVGRGDDPVEGQQLGF